MLARAGPSCAGAEPRRGADRRADGWRARRCASGAACREPAPARRAERRCRADAAAGLGRRAGPVEPDGDPRAWRRRGRRRGEPAAVAAGDAEAHGSSAALLVHKLLQLLPELPPADRAGRRPSALSPALAGASQAAERRRARATRCWRCWPGRIRRPVRPGQPGRAADLRHRGRRPVLGQIDRLVVTEREVLVVDYKSNRPPPADGRAEPPRLSAPARGLPRAAAPALSRAGRCARPALDRGAAAGRGAGRTCSTRTCTWTQAAA